MSTFTEAAGLAAASGAELGVSEWTTIAQERIDLFAEATGDRQWIHTDPARAAAGPYGTTIAHGYLTLSLLPYLAAQVFRVAAGATRVNYGINKVRFLAPVRAGARIRDRVVLGAVTDTANGQQIVVGHTVEIEGSDRPACVAETISLVLWG